MDGFTVDLSKGGQAVGFIAVGSGFCARYYTLVGRLGETKAREDLLPDKKKEAVAEARERVSIHVSVCDECQSYWKSLMAFLESRNGN